MKIALTFFLLLGLMATLRAQPLYHELAQDTIVTRAGFPSPTYLLGGKRLNLPVMQWFLIDVSGAAENIMFARVANQFSTAGYTYGVAFGMSGLLLRGTNRAVANDFLKGSVLGLGTGIAFHLVTNSLKRAAVRRYNAEVRRRLVLQRD